MVSHLRCTEYDSVKRSTEELVPMPHARLHDVSSRHSSLLDDELLAMQAELRKVHPFSKKRPPLQNAGREVAQAWKHASRMHADIVEICDLLVDTISPRAKGWTPQHAAEDDVRRLRSRLQRYPLGGLVDAGLSVAIDDILGILECHLDPLKAKAFVRDMSCFIAPNHPQNSCENASPTPATDEDSHVLHLPVLLVNHQIHDCGLDDSTRNRQRLNCVSAVQFLATLGIKDFPVYGLATSGQYGYVSSTWFSSADDVRVMCP